MLQCIFIVYGIFTFTYVDYLNISSTTVFIHQDIVVCGYPLSIFFIVVNEFCERFSYYGMRGENISYI